MKILDCIKWLFPGHLMGNMKPRIQDGVKAPPPPVKPIKNDKEA